MSARERESESEREGKRASETAREIEGVCERESKPRPADFSPRSRRRAPSPSESIDGDAGDTWYEVSGFGYRVWAFNFQLSSFRVWVPGDAVDTWFGVSGLRFRVSGVAFRVWAFGFQVSGCRLNSVEMWEAKVRNRGI